MVQINDITYNLASEFHMLRHLEKVDFLVFKRLVREGYTKNEIDEQILLTGSKFKSLFATDILSLLKKFFQYPFNEKIGSNGNLILECQVPKSDFPEGIGTNAIIPIKDIPEDKRKLVYLEKNRELNLLQFKVNVLPTTNTCTLILKPLSGGFSFVSAFPALAAMPIPNKSMKSELYNNCKKFWENHVFLKEMSQ